MSTGIELVDAEVKEMQEVLLLGFDLGRDGKSEEFEKLAKDSEPGIAEALEIGFGLGQRKDLKALVFEIGKRVEEQERGIGGCVLVRDPESVQRIRELTEALILGYEFGKDSKPGELAIRVESARTDEIKRYLREGFELGTKREDRAYQLRLMELLRERAALEARIENCRFRTGGHATELEFMLDRMRRQEPTMQGQQPAGSRAHAVRR